MTDVFRLSPSVLGELELLREIQRAATDYSDAERNYMASRARAKASSRNAREWGLLGEAQWRRAALPLGTKIKETRERLCRLADKYLEQFSAKGHA